MAADVVESETGEVIRRYVEGVNPEEVDPWENPRAEIYHQTDRFGFIYDARVARDQEEYEKIIAHERERELKWLRMIEHIWPSVRHVVKGRKKDGSSEERLEEVRDAPTMKITDPKFRRRIYKGIPDSCRARVWCHLLDLSAIKQGQDEMYQNMLHYALSDTTAKIGSDPRSVVLRQIDVDINRTLRNHKFFQARYSVKQRELFNVLAAYSVYNSEVSYCQGMNALAATLALYLETQDDVFWALVVLFTGNPYSEGPLRRNNNRFALHSFFTPDFAKNRRFTLHYNNILKARLKKLFKHMIKHQVEPELYAFRWFMEIFIGAVPHSLLFRVWDIFLLEGDYIITLFAYNIMKMHARPLLKLKQTEDIVYYLRSLSHNFHYPDDEVIESMQICRDELRKYHLLFPPRPAESELPQRPAGVVVLGSSTLENGSAKRKHSTRQQAEITLETRRVSGTVRQPQQPQQQIIVSPASQYSSSPHRSDEDVPLSLQFVTSDVREEQTVTHVRTSVSPAKQQPITQLHYQRQGEERYVVTPLPNVVEKNPAKPVPSPSTVTPVAQVARIEQVTRVEQHSEPLQTQIKMSYAAAQQQSSIENRHLTTPVKTEKNSDRSLTKTTTTTTKWSDQAHQQSHLLNQMGAETVTTSRTEVATARYTAGHRKTERMNGDYHIEPQRTTLNVTTKTLLYSEEPSPSRSPSHYSTDIDELDTRLSPPVPAAYQEPLSLDVSISSTPATQPTTPAAAADDTTSTLYTEPTTPVNSSPPLSSSTPVPVSPATAPTSPAKTLVKEEKAPVQSSLERRRETELRRRQFFTESFCQPPTVTAQSLQNNHERPVSFPSMTHTELASSCRETDICDSDEPSSRYASAGVELPPSRSVLTPVAEEVLPIAVVPSDHYEEEMEESLEAAVLI